MTNKKNYKFGTYNCYSYMKPVGRGFEVGFHFGSQAIFVGNFIHKTEATQYYAALNNEFKTFAKKYWMASETSFAWYTKLFTNYMYKHYYAWLDKKFNMYKKTYSTNFRRLEMDYKKKSRTWDKDERYMVRNKAA